MQKWTSGVRRWVIVGGLLAFALFSLLAQRAVGLNRTISPLALAARQPLAVLLAAIGCLLGGAIGSRVGQGIGRQLVRPPDQRSAYAWWLVSLWIWPWVALVIANLEGYRPSYGESAPLEALLVRLFPLTLAFKQSFPFALAAGYAWATHKPAN